MFSMFKKQKPFKAFIPEGPGGKVEMDKYSNTWKFIENWCEEELYKLRLKNDNSNLNDIETAVLRGRIKECKRILSIPNNKGILS